MAIVNYVGAQRSRPYAGLITISSATTNQLFTATYGSLWSVTYQAIGGDTTDTIASSLLSLLQGASGGFVESSFALGGNTSTITIAGPADGAPVTLAMSGNGTSSLTNVTTPLSPSDVSDGLNYSTGNLPSSGDRLVLENSAASMLYNLAALAAIPLTIDRRSTHTGQVGLPDQNAGGFREWRSTHLSANGTTLLFDESGTEQAGQYRFHWASTGNVTITATGPASGFGTLGQEDLEITGLPNGSTLNVAGARLALAPATTDTGGASTILVAGGTFRAGLGATLGNLVLDAAAQAELRANYTTLTLSGTSDVTVRGNVSGCTTVIEGGSLHWASLGNIGTTTVAGTGTLDASVAPGVFAAGNITVESGATVNDSYNRISRPISLIFDNCALQEVTILTGRGGNLTLP